jgi:hypothetical protein
MASVELVAIVLFATGIAIACAAAWRGVTRARRAAADPLRALEIMQGFRIAVLGLALAGLAAAWWWKLDALLGLTLIIAAEELLESTIGITALRAGLRRPLAAQGRPAYSQEDVLTGDTRAARPPAVPRAGIGVRAHALARERMLVRARGPGSSRGEG